MAFHWLVWFLVIGLCLLCDTRCKTAEPRTEAAVQTSLSLDRKIDNSQATPKEKAEMKADNAQMRDTLTTQGKKIVAQNEEIQRLEWYEDIFWQAVMALSGVLAGGLIVWRFKKS